MGKLEEPCFTLNPAGNCLSDLEQLSFFFFFFFLLHQGSMLVSKNGPSKFPENPFS
jgi:hypothetical protein